MRWCIGVLGLAAAVGWAGDSATTTQPTVPPVSGKLGEVVQLFDGKDLNGWVWVARPAKAGTTGPASQPAGMDAVWSVGDGVLHDKGRPIGYIRTETEYDNYVLTVEQRHIVKGNGGVLFAITGADKVWPHGLEAQGQTGEEGDLRGVSDFKITADPARMEPKRIRRMEGIVEKAAGEWETIEVTVDHGNLVVKVNGAAANVATYEGSLKGRIGLQAEGGEMEFRKIEVRGIE